MPERLGRVASIAVVAVPLMSCGTNQSDSVGGSTAEDPILTSVVKTQIDDAPETDSIVVRASSALIVIGLADGDSSYLFEDVVAVMVRSIPGEVYIADRGRREILAYGIHDGRFIRRMGGRGAGPGEFEEIGHAYLIGDSAIGVWDPALRRVSLFSTTGTVVDVRNLPRSHRASGSSSTRLARTARKLHRLEHGYLLEGRSSPLETSPDQQIGFLVVLNDALEVSDTLVRFKVPGIVAKSTTTQRSRVESYDVPPLFSPEPSLTVSVAGEVAFAPGGPYQILLWGPPDGPRMLSRAEPLVDISINDRMRKLELEAAKPENGVPPGFSIAAFEEMVRDRFALQAPTITQLMWDGPELLWVRGFDTAFDPNGPGGVWDVISVPSAKVESTVRFEHGLVPVVADGNRLFCIQRDSLGIMRVLILPHPLRRSQS